MFFPHLARLRWCQATCKGVLPWEQCAFCHPFFAFHLHGCSCEGTTSPSSLFWVPVRQSQPAPCKALSDPVKYVSDPGFPQTSSAVYTYPLEPRWPRPAGPISALCSWLSHAGSSLPVFLGEYLFSSRTWIHWNCPLGGLGRYLSRKKPMWAFALLSIAYLNVRFNMPQLH